MKKHTFELTNRPAAISDDFLSITKIEAAERQLAHAIRMFFNGEDAVSIHTLASAAYQILIDICKAKEISREIEDSAILEELGVKKEFMNALRIPQNFFKHAHDGEPDQTVRFKPLLSAYMLVSAAQYHYQITQYQLRECIVLRMWFYSRHPDRAPELMQPTLAAAELNSTDLAYFARMLDRSN
jgi:hypothetical protein